MGGKLVTDLSPADREGGGESRQPSLRYGQKFEELCGYYMSIGMTYEDYWDGDNCKAKYYRQMDEMKRERKNYELWLQGAYFYEALLDVSPVFNPLNKKKNPFPYRESPIPITEHENVKLEEKSKKKKLQSGKEAMHILMVEINKRFEENKRKEEETNHGN